MQDGKWARAPWAGSPDDEAAVLADTGASLLCVPLAQPTALGRSFTTCVYSGFQATEVAIFGVLQEEAHTCTEGPLRIGLASAAVVSRRRRVVCRIKKELFLSPALPQLNPRLRAHTHTHTHTHTTSPNSVPHALAATFWACEPLPLASRKTLISESAKRHMLSACAAAPLSSCAAAPLSSLKIFSAHIQLRLSHSIWVHL